MASTSQSSVLADGDTFEGAVNFYFDPDPSPAPETSEETHAPAEAASTHNEPVMRLPTVKRCSQQLLMTSSRGFRLNLLL